MTRVFRALAKSLTTTVIFFLLAEIVLRAAYFVRNSMVEFVPLPYALGDNYGPIPPWLDSFLILKDDDALIWKNVANVRRTYLDVFSPVWSERDRIALLRRFNPRVPEEFANNPKWDVQLNSEGYRSGEIRTEKTPSSIRIACLGDSWTFGMPVRQNETYPRRLLDRLHEERPDLQYEVLNFGVLGYSSFQGLQLLKTRVLDFHPDIVVVGFAMNDSEVAGYRDKDVMSAAGRPAVAARVKAALTEAPKRLETYKLLNYQALALRFRQKPLAEYLKDDEASQGTVDYEGLEPWTRVSPRDFESNMREIARLATERGAAVVLLDNELWEGSPYRPLLKKIALELNAPLVDSLAIINAARADIEQRLEARLDLSDRVERPEPRPPGETTVVFRAYRGAAAVPNGLSIVGADRQFGALVPNRVMMRDDGAGGDQSAGDGVWSYTATLPPAKTVSYLYTNSGREGEWEGLDVPYIRRVKIPDRSDGRPAYLPIETFGRVYMQGDHWHTDASGYDAIARAVAREVAKLR